jgi:hypothetical protein
MVGWGWWGKRKELNEAGKSYCRGMLELSTVDRLVLTNLDQLLFILKKTFYKTSYPDEEVNCTEPSPSVSIP